LETEWGWGRRYGMWNSQKLNQEEDKLWIVKKKKKKKKKKRLKNKFLKRKKIKDSKK